MTEVTIANLMVEKKFGYMLAALLERVTKHLTLGRLFLYFIPGVALLSGFSYLAKHEPIFNVGIFVIGAVLVFLLFKAKLGNLDLTSQRDKLTSEAMAHFVEEVWEKLPDDVAIRFVRDDLKVFVWNLMVGFRPKSHNLGDGFVHQGLEGSVSIEPDYERKIARFKFKPNDEKRREVYI